MSPLETLQPLLNAAHTQGQDDYREGISQTLVFKHYSAFKIAHENHEDAIRQLERELAEARAELKRKDEALRQIAATQKAEPTRDETYNLGDVFTNGWEFGEWHCAQIAAAALAQGGKEGA